MKTTLKILAVLLMLAALAAFGSPRESGQSVYLFGDEYRLPSHCTLMVESSLRDGRMAFACNPPGAQETDILVFQAAAACAPQALIDAAADAGLRDPVSRLLLDTGSERFRYRVERMRSQAFGLVAHIQVASNENVCAASFSNDSRRGRRLLSWLTGDFVDSGAGLNRLPSGAEAG